MNRIKPELLGEIFAAHAEVLALYIRQWCDHPEDIVQEVFLKLSRQRTLPDCIVPWLYKVARNAAISANRDDGRRRRREARVAELKSWFVTTIDPIDAEAATKLLNELEPETRGVIVARIWGGLTFEQIAEVQGCSQATAHRRYRNGLKRLHEGFDRP